MEIIVNFQSARQTESSVVLRYEKFNLFYAESAVILGYIYVFILRLYFGRGMKEIFSGWAFFIFRASDWKVSS